MKKHGFTLIELLAVIVILAIIALIATPMILGVINTAKKGSAESAALGYIDAVEKATVISLLDSENTGAKTISAQEYKVSANGKTITGVTTPSETLAIDFKGEAPVDGSTVKVESDGTIKTAHLGFDSIYAYWVNVTAGKATASDVKINS